jgi:phosphoglycolate phosphatase-like HAD superfamily hydrolase
VTGSAGPPGRPHPAAPVRHRLVLWNVDLTLVDVARVSRDAYAEAFRRVTGRPLVALPLLAGASDSEIFFDALALNRPPPGPGGDGAGGSQRPPDAELLIAYLAELAEAFAERRDLMPALGRLLPGAREALAAVAALPGVIQSVLTGGIKTNATEKLRVFGLDTYLDAEIGGYGSDAYPKAAALVRCRTLAEDKYGVRLGPDTTVYLADSVRDARAALIGGARWVGVASGRSTAAELLAAGAARVLRDLSDTGAVVAAVEAVTGAPAA